MFVPNFVEIGQLVKKLKVGDTHRQHSVHLTYFLSLRRENGLIITHHLYKVHEINTSREGCVC
jgi:hypothetical protein